MTAAALAWCSVQRILLKNKFTIKKGRDKMPRCKNVGNGDCFLNWTKMVYATNVLWNLAMI